MIQRRTFIQSITAWLSSIGLFAKTPVVSTEHQQGNPTGWTITWHDLESDKSLGYWMATPQSADRCVAFRVLVARPAGLVRRVNERTVPNDVMWHVSGEMAVLEGRGHRAYRDGVAYWDDPEWDEIDVKPTHYVIWEEELIPPKPEAIEAAKQERRENLIGLINISRNGKQPLIYPSNDPCINESGERIRIKPEGYVETVGMNAEDRAVEAKRQAFSENQPAFWELMHTTFDELWFGSDYPTKITCGYLAYKTMQGYIEKGLVPNLRSFCGQSVIMSRSMKIRQVRFENPDFPGDPKYNRVIEMPDEAYIQ